MWLVGEDGTHTEMKEHSLVMGFVYCRCKTKTTMVAETKWFAVGCSWHTRFSRACCKSMSCS